MRVIKETMTTNKAHRYPPRVSPLKIRGERGVMKIMETTPLLSHLLKGGNVGHGVILTFSFCLSSGFWNLRFI
jgi:hypothetical protein